MTKRQWFAAFTILAFVANPALGVAMLMVALCVISALVILAALAGFLSSNY